MERFIMRHFITLIAILWLGNTLHAQVIQWKQSFGGLNDDYAYSLEPIPESNGFYVAGQSLSPQSGDFTVDNHGWWEYRIVKFDSSGYSPSAHWQAHYGGTDGDYGRELQIAPGGDLIMAGSAASTDHDLSDEPVNGVGENYYVLELDSSSGNIDWDSTYGNGSDEHLRGMDLNSDGDRLMVGGANSSGGDVPGNYGSWDVWALALDSSNNLLWSQNYGSTEYDVARDVEWTRDGGAVIVGRVAGVDEDLSGPALGGEDMWFLKLDSAGNIEQEHNYGGSEHDRGDAVIQSSDGGYVIAGGSMSADQDLDSNQGHWDQWVLKLDASGDVQWSKSFGGAGYDNATDIVETDAGNLYVVGRSESDSIHIPGNHGEGDITLFKLSKSGDIVWRAHYGGSSDEEVYELELSDDGHPLIAGHSESNDIDLSKNEGGFDWWVFKVKDTLQGRPSSLRTFDEDAASMTLYPNPTEERISLTLEGPYRNFRVTVRDLEGRAVQEEAFSNTERAVMQIDGDAGLYFLEVRTADGEFIGTKKLVKE